jgi:uncharacterized membrane protein YraQ (UPF0718 family)
MKNKEMQKETKKPPFFWGALFLSFILLIYGSLFLIVPEKTHAAFRESGRIATHILWPLCIVFGVMMILNLFINPSRVARLVGEKTGFLGVLLAAAAGTLSMGPIYAWYPFLKDVRTKGAGPRPIAVFLGNRAIKPLLLPIMVSYFGWFYTLLFTALTFLGAMGCGCLMGYFVKK